MSRLHAVFPHVDLVILKTFEGITQTSQFNIDNLESYALLVSAVFLLILVAVATALYYRRIKGVKATYEEAKEIVGDVVFSFNKQLQRHEEELQKASYRIEGLSTRSENVVTKMEELEKQTSDLASKAASSSETQDRLAKDIEDVETRLNEMRKTQEEIIKQVSETPEARIEAEAAIPIKREHALAPLTETELRVLEFIAEGGEKTAPEIRDLTKLTREHSARLVKKLYEEGYLERDTGKAPYRYRVKDEMLKILKKSEAKA